TFLQRSLPFQTGVSTEEEAHVSEGMIVVDPEIGKDLRKARERPLIGELPGRVEEDPPFPRHRDKGPSGPAFLHGSGGMPRIPPTSVSASGSPSSLSNALRSCSPPL